MQEHSEEAVTPAGSGVFVVNFTKSPALCRGLHSALQRGLTSTLPLRSDDFALAFEPRSEWGSSTPSETVRHDLEAISRKYSAWKFGNRVLGLALLPHKPSTLAETIISSLKGQQTSVQAKAQACSGST